LFSYRREVNEMDDDYVADIDELKVDQLRSDLELTLEDSDVVKKLQDVVLEPEVTPDQRVEAMEEIVEYFDAALRIRCLSFKPGGLKKFNPESGEYEPFEFAST
jgi:hypothetical protein